MNPRAMLKLDLQAVSLERRRSLLVGVHLRVNTAGKRLLKLGS